MSHTPLIGNPILSKDAYTGVTNNAFGGCGFCPGESADLGYLTAAWQDHSSVSWQSIFQVSFSGGSYTSVWAQAAASYGFKFFGSGMAVRSPDGTGFYFLMQSTTVSTSYQLGFFKFSDHSVAFTAITDSAGLISGLQYYVKMAFAPGQPGVVIVCANRISQNHPVGINLSDGSLFDYRTATAGCPALPYAEFVNSKQAYGLFGTDVGQGDNQQTAIKLTTNVEGFYEEFAALNDFSLGVNNPTTFPDFPSSFTSGVLANTFGASKIVGLALDDSGHLYFAIDSANSIGPYNGIYYLDIASGRIHRVTTWTTDKGMLSLVWHPLANAVMGASYGGDVYAWT